MSSKTNQYIGVQSAKEITSSKLYLSLGLIFLLILLVPNLLDAQAYLWKTERLTPEQGLANLMTTAITKDQQGFMWIATDKGLNRYDGYNFELFNPVTNEENTDIAIHEMKVDEQGKLWLFSSKGMGSSLLNNGKVSNITIFDPILKTQVSLKNYYAKPLPFDIKNVILPKIIDPKNRIWVATTKGELFLLENGDFHKIFHQPNILFQHITIDMLDRIWLGWQKNVLSISLNGKVLEELQLPQLIAGIWADQQAQLWLATYEKEFIIANEEVKRWQYQLQIWLKTTNDTLQVVPFTNKGVSIDIQSINDIFIHRSEQGIWYVGRNQELCFFDQNGHFIGDYATINGQKLKSNFSNYFEDQSIVWGTTSIGIVKAEIENNSFQLIHHLDDSFSDCRGITEGAEGHIYFLNKKLYSYNPATQKAVAEGKIVGSYSLYYADSIIWTSIYNDKKCGQHLDLDTKQHYKYPCLDTAIIYAVLPLDSSPHLLAGRQKGLCFVDMHQKKLVPFEKYNDFEQLKNSHVYFLHRTELGIWLATSKGLFLMEEQKGIIRHYTKENNALPFHHIKHIHEDKVGAFWLATVGGGIIRWHPDSLQRQAFPTKQWTTQDGLSHNATYAIYEDDYGKLWIPSDKGLMCMDKQSERIRIFLVEDGLPHNEFNTTSHYQAKDGTLFFGGLGGLISFHPGIFTTEQQVTTPALALLNYSLLEEEAKELTDKTAQLLQTSKIVLCPSDKFAELTFALLDYQSPSQHSYTYQLEGYSNRLITQNNKYQITHLPYGNYRLKVRAWNNNNSSAISELDFDIVVVRPFYLQWGFLISILIAFIGLILLGVKLRFWQLNKEKAILEQEVLKRTQTIQQQTDDLQALDRAKTQFFSNITHEFRTPLTLIIGPIKQLLEKKQIYNGTKKQLQGVVYNAEHILQLINQLLDLSKIENNKMTSSILQGDIISYTQRLLQPFRVLAQEKAQQLVFESNQISWNIHFDQDKWHKILYNLVANAIKFTPAKEGITIQVDKLERADQIYIQLIVKDTGIGIPSEKLPKIFDRFYQANNTFTRIKDGAGIGLALVKELVELQNGQVSVVSEETKGTSFEVLLPVFPKESVVSSMGSLENLTVGGYLKEEYDINLIDITKRIHGFNKNIKLLLIEDNTEMRTYIRQCFDAYNYSIIEAIDGIEGIQKAQSLIPDIIITDIMMPEKDGFEVILALRNHVNTSHIPIIVLTAKAALDSRLMGLELGADAYLTKPFSPKELIIQAQKLLEMRQLLQQYFQKERAVGNKKEYTQEADFLKKVKEYILEHLDESSLNGEQIGQHFAMSRVQLHRKLKALTEQSASQFIKAVRLEKALALIHEGELNLSEIAFRTGFNSLSYFSRTFKTTYGKSPSEMLKVKKSTI